MEIQNTPSHSTFSNIACKLFILNSSNKIENYLLFNSKYFKILIELKSMIYSQLDLESIKKKLSVKITGKIRSRKFKRWFFKIEARCFKVKTRHFKIE